MPDHSPRTRRQLIAAGVVDPDRWQYLVPRCAPCHARKTVKFDGALGRPTKKSI